MRRAHFPACTAELSSRRTYSDTAAAAISIPARPTFAFFSVSQFHPGSRSTHFATTCAARKYFAPQFAAFAACRSLASTIFTIAAIGFHISNRVRVSFASTIEPSRSRPTNQQRAPPVPAPRKVPLLSALTCEHVKSSQTPPPLSHAFPLASLSPFLRCPSQQLQLVRTPEQLPDRSVLSPRAHSLPASSSVASKQPIKPPPPSPQSSSLHRTHFPPMSFRDSDRVTNESSTRATPALRDFSINQLTCQLAIITLVPPFNGYEMSQERVR